jgi:hypothetical protein
MFEVGKSYSIKMWADDDNRGIITEHHGCKILDVQMPVIKIRQTLMGGEIIEIINTASIAFVSAVPEEG